MTENKTEVQPAAAVPNTMATTVTSHFKMIFICILLITVSCGVGNFWMAMGIQQPTSSQQDVMSTMSTVWKMGVGSIFGLLGAKAT